MPGEESVMEPKDFISADAKEGVASIAVKSFVNKSGDVLSGNIKVIGASMKISAPKETFLKSFSLQLEKEDEKGVLAVILMDTDGQMVPFFIGVQRHETGQNKISVSRHSIFVPDPGRMGQIDDRGRITIAVDDIIYTNKYPDNLNNPHPEYRLVDGDSLCKHMVSLIDKDQLAQASEEHIAALFQLEYIKNLEEQVNVLKNDPTILQSLKDENEAGREYNGQLEKKIRELIDMAKVLRISAFKDYVGGKEYFFSGPIYKALENFFAKAIPGHVNR